MTYTKEVYKIDKDGNKTVEMKQCHPRQLPLTTKYIAPYWFQAFQNVYKYQKRRDLVEVHKLFSDDRIKRGLDLYRNKGITHNVVTTVYGGDVHATVKRETGPEHTVVMKNFLPAKLPQYNHEREEYLANLFVSCDCKDSQMGRYRDNASLFCQHISAVIWYLQAEFNMPIIFVSPEAKQLGYSKSNTEEIATNIKALPLVKFTQYINILVLKNYRGIPAATALSVHRIDNETNKEESRPQWLTFVEPKDVEKIFIGFIEAYKKMRQERGDSDESIIEHLQTLLLPKPAPKKPSWWERLKIGGRK